MSLASFAHEPRCHIDPWLGGEKQLLTRVPVAEGDLVVMERPFATVPKGEYRHGSHAWDLTAALLASIEKRKRLFDAQLKLTEFLWYPDDGPTERELSKKYNLQRAMVRKIFFMVSTNNISYFDEKAEIAGWGLYEMLSRANHSCEPNTRLLAGRAEFKEVGLVATRDIAAGEPVTWNYSGNDEFLLEDYEARNHAIVNYMRFVCQCPRCVSEAPAHLGGPAQQLRYFDEIIRREAAELLQRQP